MTRIFLVSVAVAVLVAAQDEQLETKCDKNLLDFACGAEGEKMAADLEDSMSEECKKKSQEVKSKYHDKHKAACDAKENVENTCKELMNIFEKAKTEMGECMPKMSE